MTPEPQNHGMRRTEASPLSQRRHSVVEPRRIQIIWHSIRKGQVTQQTQDVWLILEERPATKDGYIIVFEESRKMFGLASPGFPSDPHRCLDGYYRDFWTAFEGM